MDCDLVSNPPAIYSKAKYFCAVWLVYNFPYTQHSNLYLYEQSDNI
jgi:hypothetical protein